MSGYAVQERPALRRWLAVRPWLVTAARGTLAVVFGIAGGSKVGDVEAAKLTVRAYQLLPENLADVVGVVLPYLEIALAVLLLVGFGTRWAAAVVALLLVVFIVGIASLWIRGIEMNCGCFGSGLLTTGETTSYPWEILRDVGLLILAALCVLWPISRLSLDAVLAPADDPSEPDPEPDYSEPERT